MKHKWIVWLTAAVLAVLSVTAAAAAVNFTEEPTGGDTVYIAGNPDAYPIEYYDAEAKEYRGMLPALYRRISEESGIDFTYVSAGRADQQVRLAKNRQVEIVSAHRKGAVPGLKDETVLYRSGGDELCVGFTAIASDELVKTVGSALRTAPSDEIWRLSAENAAEPPGRFPHYLLFIIGGLLLVIAVLAVWLLKKRKNEQRLRENKLTDTLTGIGNLQYFERGYRDIARSPSCTRCYIAYIGIDTKRVIQYADQAVSEEIQRCAASEIAAATDDGGFCARVSDGRFALAFTAPDEQTAWEKLEALLERLNRIDSDVMIRYHLRFAAGVFRLGASPVSCKQAMLNARHGFYRARELHQPYAVCDAKLLRREEYVHSLKEKLWKAIDEREFKLYIQYIFDGRGETACGGEALSRWESPENGVIYPGEYIEMLETADMIDELDLYILSECCRTLSAWRGTEKQNLWLSCNMTRITLSDDAFLERFCKVTEAYDFDHGKLVLEITEDALADNSEQIVRNIERCKQMGYRIALDDFGNGYSSVRDLDDYPIDIIKIDRDIILGSRSDRGKRLLIGIVGLAHFLGIEALCEGVEIEQERAAAREAECDYIQGYLLAHPAPADEKSTDRGVVFA